jgi:glycosyltransferase involved in cell wall biosynthesis
VPVVWHLRDRIAEDYLPRAGVRLVRAAGRRLPHGVIAVSQAALATLDLPPGRQGCPSWVIYDPVEPQPRRPDRADGPLRVGMVGRIAPWKGQDLFLRSVAEAFPSGPQRAVVVGAPLFGEQEYEATLRELTAELGLERRVSFEGFKEDVAAELGNLDVLVHASVIPEPLGQVVMEGMAAGVAVVAPAAGGPAEIVEDGVTGLLYPPGDTRSLARALSRLAGSRGLREELGAAARRRSADFAPQVTADLVTTAYAQTLARTRR